jgi:hypothetical protein
MTRPTRLAKQKALHAIENNDANFMPCPLPLRERIQALHHGTYPSSSQISCVPPSSAPVGRGLMARKSFHNQLSVGAKNLTSPPSSSSIGRGLMLLQPPHHQTHVEVNNFSDTDNDSPSDHDSESESESDEAFKSESESSNSESNNSDIEVSPDQDSFQGRDGTVWGRQPLQSGRRKAVNVMRSPGGLSAFGRQHCKETGLSNWQVLFPPDLVNIIVECTNDKARSEEFNFSTNREEITTYIGVCILIGVYKGKGEPIRGLWSPTEGRKCISQFMPRVRFELITKFMRYDITSSRQNRRQISKFAPMGTVFDMWEQRLSRPFIPHEYVTVDETLVPFRGRCSFRQYMPAKPAKYGIKFFCLCDATTAYCMRVRPYLGTDNGANRAVGLAQQVVLDLVKGLDVGRTVVTDNFYTSLELAKNLKERSLGLLGTMRKNRREIPPEFVNAKRNAGTTLFGFNELATLVSYSPKKSKVVVLLSSEHIDDTVDTRSGKPDIILTYNPNKGGVDHLDKMCQAYTTRKRTERWPKCVFQHMIDVTAYNAFVLWREVTGDKKTKRRQFLKMLGAQLCGGGVDETGNVIHLAAHVTSAPEAIAGTRLRCRKCVQLKTVQRCKECGVPLCINCALYKCPEC